MLSEKKRRIPQFSLSWLLLFASAVAIGFAVSQKAAADQPETWSSFAEQAFYPPTLLAIAAVLVVFELVRQWKLIRKMVSDNNRVPFEYWFAWVVRLILVVGIVALLLLTQLINRQILTIPEPEEFMQFYGELWPGTLQMLLLLSAMRLMTLRSATEEFWLKKSMTILIVAVGIVVIGLYIITDRLLVSWLVHLAIDGVEKSHAVRWHRAGVFPNHATEGFQSFWSAFAALLVVLAGCAALFLTAIVRRRGIFVVLWGLFASSLVGAAGYSWWFVTQEFPRINPDLAGQSLPVRWSDLVAGAMLLSGTAAVVGYQLAILRSRRSDWPKRKSLSLPQPSGLMVIAAGLIVLGCGSDSLLVAYESFVTPTWWGASDLAWVNTLVSLVQCFILPESIIVLVTAISGINVVWQYCRPVITPRSLTPIRGLHFSIYTIAMSVFFAAAVPVFTAFGFCYWLGPLVL